MLAAVVCAGLGVTASSAARTNALATKQWATSASTHTASSRLAGLRAALASTVAIVPAPGSTNVPLDAPVVVATRVGAVSNVHAIAAGGTPLGGALTNGATSWWSSGALAPNTDYHVDATVTSPTGVQVNVSTSFHSLTPTGFIGATLSPSDGSTVGVGQPIVLRFDQPVTDPAGQAAIAKHVFVSAPKGVEGGWHWFSDKELHFRPKNYWPAGAQITVTEDLNSWNAGGGMWGTGFQQVHFTIGDSHVSIANLASDVMTVMDNGKVIATYPMSGGRPKYPTMNGTHIVLDREPVVHMVSSTVGIPVKSPDGYDEFVYNDVHISDSGEYVHAAPWSVGSQGHTNVSHGCINLSSANALQFFGFSQVGDIVQVIGGPRPPETGDHGVMDWDTDWSQWIPGIVLH
jgi:lipoprotein-anchoring transpeptidase ErfK/SrfK